MAFSQVAFFIGRLSSLQLVVAETRHVADVLVETELPRLQLSVLLLASQLGPVLLSRQAPFRRPAAERQGSLRRSPANPPLTLAPGGRHQNPMIYSDEM